jgi:hypothetical protein
MNCGIQAPHHRASRMGRGLRPMRCPTDEQREHHIKFFGQKMEAAMARWEAYGCFDDRVEADKWRVAMEVAIRARSPAQVARMEVELGLA